MRRFPKVRRASVNQGGVGTETVVNGQGNGVITVLNYALTLGGDGTLTFRSSGGRELGAFDILASGGIVAPDSLKGWFDTDPGEGLQIVTTGGVVRGHLSYERNA